MKRIAFIVLAMLGVTASYASIPTMSAANQDYERGSFYLYDVRNIYRNPLAIDDQAESIYVEGEKEAGYVSDDFAIAFGRPALGHKEMPLLDTVFAINDMWAAGVFLNAQNGKGIPIIGASMGVELVDMLDLYFSPSFMKREYFDDSDVNLTMGLTYKIDLYTLYGEYSDNLDGIGFDNSFNFGLGYVSEKKGTGWFADANVVLLKYEGLERDEDLNVKLGGLYVVEKIDTQLIASIKQSIFFKQAATVGLGASFCPTKHLAFDGSVEADKIGKDQNINFKIGFTYML